MEIISFVISVFCGVLTGLGVGGGSLLIIWMTVFCSISPAEASGINLLYFFPTATAACICHLKAKTIQWHLVLPAALFGCSGAFVGTWLSSYLPGTLLKNIFAIFLIISGILQIKKAQRP